VPAKLEQIIAKVAVEAAGPDPVKMMAVAGDVAAQVTDEVAAKLPERWYPKVTSKEAGVPHLRDSWPRAWFEGVVEILCQKGKAGLPALFELLERDSAAYHEMVVLRLLRMAAAGVEEKPILQQLKSRLPALHRTAAYASVREVVFWCERDQKPLKLLKGLAKLRVKDGEGDTIGTYIKQFEGELALVKAKRAPEKSANPLDEEIVSTAILALEPEAFRIRAAEAARTLGPGKIGALAKRLKKPDVKTLQSRAPSALAALEAAWCRAVLEILGHLGREAIPVVRSVKANDEYVREKALRIVCLLAARHPGPDRETITSELRRRLASLHHRDLRPIISELLLDARTEPAVLKVLDELAGLSAKDYGEGRIALGDIVRQLYVPPKPHASPAAREPCKALAERLAAAVVAQDFGAVRSMLAGPLQKKFTTKKLAQLVAEESKHSGPPDAFRFADGELTAADLREEAGGSTPLPAHVTDGNFRRWCCIEFLPEEGSQVDACFDWWMAVMDEKGKLAVGFFHITDAD
jgi:hypothetical protein